MAVSQQAFPQGERSRVVVQGKLADGGGTCTVLLVQDALGWLLYPHGDPHLAVRLTGEDAVRLTVGVIDGEPRCAGRLLMRPESARLLTLLTEPR